MNKSILILAAMLVSNLSFAAKPDFSTFDHDGDHGQLKECIHKAWEASAPTDEQNKQACDLMSAAKAVFEEHKAAIHEAIQGMMHAWKKYPVVKDDVVAAEHVLEGAVKPVMETMRDTHIDILNLLSASQRASFDQTFKDCIQH